MNLFTHARTKLTIYYLAIIMAISGFFSMVIYRGATLELTRIQNVQKIRRPGGPQFLIDEDIVTESKERVFISLLSLNALILALSGIGGYFLAGKTLKPIADIMNEQKEFVANASHELRTPLTSLTTEIEVALRDKKLTLNTAKKLLESNLEDVKNITKLSNYLLRLNKLQSDQKSNYTKIDLAQVVKKIALKNKKVKLITKKTMIKADAESISELAKILIENGLKYSDNKPVTVVVKNKSLEVSDQGIGISDKDLPHIFGRFFRGDRARQTEGYGLGLSIAKQIAKNHNAQIRVVSKLAKGSTFKVKFS